MDNNTPIKTKEKEEANMIKTTRLSSLMILALIVAVAVIGFVAGCGDDGATTTSGSSSATDGASATTSVSQSPTDSATDQTMVVGGKTRADYEAEIPLLQQALADNPRDLDLLQQLAIAQYQLRRYEEAEATYLIMLEISDEAFTHNNLGNVYRDWGQIDKAKAEYETAISLDPTLDYAYVNLAQVYKSEGDIAAAVEVMERGVEALTGEEQKRLEGIKENLTTTTT